MKNCGSYLELGDLIIDFASSLPLVVFTGLGSGALCLSDFGVAGSLNKSIKLYHSTVNGYFLTFFFALFYIISQGFLV